LLKGKLSGLIALSLVAVFMLNFYRFLGLLANVALVINLVLVVGLLAMLRATLTLAGDCGYHRWPSGWRLTPTS
jgi:preprotein translocase subunit SecD